MILTFMGLKFLAPSLKSRRTVVPTQVIQGTEQVRPAFQPNTQREGVPGLKAHIGSWFRLKGSVVSFTLLCRCKKRESQVIIEIW